MRNEQFLKQVDQNWILKGRRHTEPLQRVVLFETHRFNALFRSEPVTPSPPEVDIHEYFNRPTEQRPLISWFTDFFQSLVLRATSSSSTLRA